MKLVKMVLMFSYTVFMTIAGSSLLNASLTTCFFASVE